MHWCAAITAAARAGQGWEQMRKGMGREQKVAGSWPWGMRGVTVNMGSGYQSGRGHLRMRWGLWGAERRTTVSMGSSSRRGVVTGMRKGECRGQGDHQGIEEESRLSGSGPWECGGILACPLTGWGWRQRPTGAARQSCGPTVPRGKAPSVRQSFHRLPGQLRGGEP